MSGTAISTLPALVEASARRTPDAVALVTSSDRQITYTELVGFAESIAASIAERSSGRIVGIFMLPSAWTTIAALGAMRAGRAYLPLDPTLPEERLRTMVSSVDCDCLLTGLDQEPPRWFDRNELVAEAAAAAGRSAPRETTADPRQLAYVIFTSGSTGTPKAVGVPQDAAAVFTDLTGRRLGLDANDTVLQIHSTGFDSSIEEVWSTLARGSRLIARSTRSLDIEGVLAQAVAHRATVLHMPTSFWRAFTEETLRGMATDGLDALRQIEIGGEPMWLADFETWRASPLRELQLHNGYGPTEAVVTATGFLIGPETSLPTGGGSVPIGRALAERILYVLDEHGQPVEPGCPGELSIGGDLLATGYLNDPALTDERFVPDEFRGAGRRYRTGDIVRDLDGELEFLGRIDDQVKIRGFRVELGEISNALRTLDGVRDASTLLLDPDRGRLCSAVVFEPGLEMTPARIAGGLRSVLPGYMVPSEIVPLSAIPTAASGKVDKAALRSLLEKANDPE